MAKITKKNSSQLSLFNIEKKIEQSTATVAELRVPIFLPFKKIAHNSNLALDFKKKGGKLSLETSWGTVTIRGRKLLTDVHRDILDCIYTYNSKTMLCPNGEIEIFFTLTNILKHYGLKNPNANISWLKERIEEIRDTAIDYKDTKNNSFDFNIISNLAYLEENKMYKITLDRRYVKFYETELSINYKKELPSLLKVDSALIKTIIRWFFTHSAQCSYKLTTVLEAVGIKTDVMSDRMKQINKKTIRESIATLNKFGIDFNVNDEIFFYSGNQNVAFIPSLFNQYNDSSKIITLKEFDDCKNIEILIDDKKYIIANVDFTIEDDDILDATIKITTGEVLKLSNKNSKSENDFKKEVFSWIEENKIK